MTDVSEPHRGQLADLLPSQAWTARADGTLDYVNQRVLDYFGRSLPQMLGEGWQDVVHPEDRPTCVERWSHSLLSGEAYDVQFRLRRGADGGYRWHQGMARPLRNDRNVIVQWLGANTDIDDEKQAQQRLRAAAEALRDSERQLRLALKAGQLGTWQWDITAGIVHWSPELETMHGIPVGSFPGTFEAYQRDIHPEDRERVLNTVRTNLQAAADHRLLYRIVRPDGGVRWLEAHGRFDLADDGTPRRLVGVCSDVTDRVQAEAARLELVVEQTARREADKLAARIAASAALRGEIAAAVGHSDLAVLLKRCCDAVVNHLPISAAQVWLLDASGHWLDLQGSAGPVSDGGATRVELGSREIGIIATQRSAMMTNTLLDETWLADKEGARREGLVAFAGFPLLAGEAAIGVLATFAKVGITDDTLGTLAAASEAIAHGVERRRSELALADRARELARSNAELEQFAYVASHDLQEPLRIIASYNQLLARRYKDQLDQDANEFIAFTVDGVARMQRLINDLLAYSRVKTHAHAWAQVAMEGVLNAALRNLAKTVEEQGARVTHDPLPQVAGDEGQLTQLLQNLIGNAIKFHGAEPPAVHLSARREGAEWIFRLRDNGVGIEPQYFDRIFVIFQRLHSTERYPGTGIGLAVCKKIVERHSGRIWVESTLGKGSTFAFALPDPPSEIRSNVR